MEIRQIIYFLTLCEELHFTRAARRCGIAQPSVTHAIRLLDHEFGAPLLHRKPRPRLSRLGAAVRPELQRALAYVARALAHGRQASTRRRGARPMRNGREYEEGRGYAALTGVPPAADAPVRFLRRSGPR
jgi:DNA-binding transcriptional LysR family regulator